MASKVFKNISYIWYGHLHKHMHMGVVYTQHTVVWFYQFPSTSHSSRISSHYISKPEITVTFNILCPEIN